MGCFITFLAVRFMSSSLFGWREMYRYGFMQAGEVAMPSEISRPTMVDGGQRQQLDASMRMLIAEVWKQVVMALLLAWTAGSVDAIGFLVLLHIYTSNMSGNSITVGIALGARDTARALLHFLPIPLFVLGVVCGTLLLSWLHGRKIRSPFALVLTLESLFLLAFLVIFTYVIPLDWLSLSHIGIFAFGMTLLTMAMGLQTATLHHVSNQKVRTTFVTGILTDFGYLIAKYLLWWFEQVRARGFWSSMRGSMQQTSFRYVLLLGSIWCFYVFGAFCGGYAESHLLLLALLFPLGVIVVVIGIDVFAPF
jgi:uncharacterized membrane protein YoaK (UPF0700 family)